jgi:hypothetical protein
VGPSESVTNSSRGTEAVPKSEGLVNEAQRDIGLHDLGT